MAKTAFYNAVSGPYHYPEGVMAVGETAELSDEDAARGLESGALVESSPSKGASKTEETT